MGGEKGIGEKISSVVLVSIMCGILKKGMLEQCVITGILVTCRGKYSHQITSKHNV